MASWEEAGIDDSAVHVHPAGWSHVPSARAFMQPARHHALAVVRRAPKLECRASIVQVRLHLDARRPGHRSTPTSARSRPMRHADRRQSALPAVLSRRRDRSSSKVPRSSTREIDLVYTRRIADPSLGWQGDWSAGTRTRSGRHRCTTTREEEASHGIGAGPRRWRLANRRASSGSHERHLGLRRQQQRRCTWARTATMTSKRPKTGSRRGRALSQLADGTRNAVHRSRHAACASDRRCSSPGQLAGQLDEASTASGNYPTERGSLDDYAYEAEL